MTLEMGPDPLTVLFHLIFFYRISKVQYLIIEINFFRKRNIYFIN